MTRVPRWTSFVLVAGVAACGEGPAPEAGDGAAAGAEAPAGELQALIQLPADFAPEGIAIAGDTFYVGSLAPPTAGQILAGDLRTGQFRELVPATGVSALGLKHDARSNLLYVAGGATGTGHVFDAATGAEVAAYEFNSEGQTINDVIVTRDAAYFTNSAAPVLYRVAIGADGRPAEFSALDLPANFGVGGACEGVSAIMANGIEASPDGRYLILIHMSEGQLYRMDTQSGEVQQVQLTGGDLCSADGLELDGNTIYGVQNFTNQVGVVELGPDYLTGTVVRRITEPFASNPATKIPTTIADAGEALYAVTAGFAEPSPDYVVRVEK